MYMLYNIECLLITRTLPHHIEYAESEGIAIIIIIYIYNELSLTIAMEFTYD